MKKYGNKSFLGEIFIKNVLNYSILSIMIVSALKKKECNPNRYKGS